jgi:16S rRNA (adenine1518-N6/adenine1519-N6)-dimethyltransferase
MDHRPRRRYSQNFLIDAAMVSRIVATVAPGAGDRMVEIGPGLGALTAPLSAVVQPLHVVEIDRDLAERLRVRFPPERVAVHEIDALRFDFAALGRALRVVGNLPYHISTPLLFHLAAAADALLDVHAMLQLEVVERIAAAPGDPRYGRPSVMLQYRFAIEKLFEIGPEAFRPPPRVRSAIVRMVPLPAARLRARDEALLEGTVAAAFSHRRKTLRNTLGRYLTAGDFEALGIDPRTRAQTLSVADFVRIADYRARAEA